jgi:hypothetical protein
VGEKRIRIASGDRSREHLVADLRRALEALTSSEHADRVRVEEWWDESSPEVWVRTVSGARARWRIGVTADGYEILLRGALGVRWFLPPALRAMMRALEGG